MPLVKYMLFTMHTKAADNGNGTIIFHPNDNLNHTSNGSSFRHTATVLEPEAPL